MPQLDTDDTPLDRRVTRQRTVQLRRAKATIALLIDEIGAHAAVVLLNDGLREALDRLGDEG
jgi:Mg2+/Co2+ transporter CorB